eukprot:12420548-Karenia_brevis.AAC.1
MMMMMMMMIMGLGPGPSGAQGAGGVFQVGGLLGTSKSPRKGMLGTSKSPEKLPEMFPEGARK